MTVMDCFSCSDISCKMCGNQDSSGVYKCFYCEYVKILRLNEQCRLCFSGGCGFLERLEELERLERRQADEV